MRTPALIVRLTVVVPLLGPGSGRLQFRRPSSTRRTARKNCTQTRATTCPSGSYDRASRRSSGSRAVLPGRCWRSRRAGAAYAYWKTGERAQAQSTLDRFIKLHPSSPALDYALYLKGIVHFNDNLGILSSISRQDISERDQQASRDAYQAFKQLVEQFPTSRYSADARVRMTNRQRAGAVRASRGALLLPARRLRAAARRAAVRDSNKRRRWKRRCNPGGRATTSWAGRSARRRRPCAEEELPRQPLRQGRHPPPDDPWWKFRLARGRWRQRSGVVRRGQLVDQAMPLLHHRAAPFWR